MTPPTDRHCHARRHLTPSQYMTYDAMRAMAKAEKNDPLLTCYAKVTTIVDRTSVGRTQTIENIKALVTKGWLIPRDKIRWKAGQFGNNHYVVLDHDDYARYAARREDDRYEFCPPFQYDAKTGEKLEKGEMPEEFGIAVEGRKWARENRALIQAIQELNNSMTREEWEKIFNPPDIEETSQ